MSSRDVTMSQPTSGRRPLNVNMSATAQPSRVNRLPMDKVKMGGSGSNSQRFGRTDVMSNQDRQDLIYNVQGENNVLKKANQKLMDQVKQLGVRYGQIQREMVREGLASEKTQGMEEVQKLQEAIRMKARTGSISGNKGSSSPSKGLTKHTKKSLLGGL